MKTTLLFSTLLLVCITGLFSQNHPPVAVNDTVTCFMGYFVDVNVLKNDFDPDGDSIYVAGIQSLQIINDSTWRATLHNLYPDNYETVKQYLYEIKDKTGAASFAYVVVKIRAIAMFDFLNVNNINALISPFGNHFWDLDSSRFEVPKGSGIHSLFNQAFWIGGLDDTSTLHIAAERYRQTGSDYFTGPISTSYDTNYLLKWNRLWKLDKEQIRYHINNWSKWGYIPIEAIANWPAHGDSPFGQSANIAPFYDSDLDHIYNPMAGDYPLIRGDQAIFFILNDIKEYHTESKGRQLGIEIHGMAYAFNHPDDSTLNNTIFMHYEVINRSVTNYHDTYLGWYTDFDLGYTADDYLGTDVTNGMLYSYNGDSIDGNGETVSYGAHPPALGMKVIGGPFLDADGIDNPKGNCDEGINGLNFGDGITDNERMGLSSTVNSGWSNGIYNFNPYNAIKGGYIPYGEGDSIHAVGPACKYVFPGDSDTLCNWGTYGTLPYGGFNQNGYYWTEKTVGNLPNDRRAVGSVGPFTFNAGEMVPVDYCITWARDCQGDNISSLELLRERISSVSPSWKTLIELPKTYNGIVENTPLKTIKFYPNPVHENATIILDGKEPLHYYLYTIDGMLVLKGILKPGSNSLEFSSLNPGVYLLRCGDKHLKVIKI